MLFFRKAKDGGDKSHVTGFFVIEIKRLFSVVLLRFDNGTREAYHNHAFNALTWVLKGEYEERQLNGKVRTVRRAWKPKFTPRSNFHKVISKGVTYALTLRGPWSKTWKEFLPETQEFVTLSNGRKVISRIPVRVKGAGAR